MLIGIEHRVAGCGVGFASIATAKERTRHTITPDHVKQDGQAKRPDKDKTKDHSD